MTFISLHKSDILAMVLFSVELISLHRPFMFLCINCDFEFSYDIHFTAWTMNGCCVHHGFKFNYGISLYILLIYSLRLMCVTKPLRYFLVTVHQILLNIGIQFTRKAALYNTNNHS